MNNKKADAYLIRYLDEIYPNNSSASEVLAFDIKSTRRTLGESDAAILALYAEIYRGLSS